MAGQRITSDGTAVPLECLELPASHPAFGNIVPGPHCDARTRAFAGADKRSTSESFAAVENESHWSLIVQLHIHHCLKDPSSHRNP
jgi:hypothetical protein